MKTWIILSCLVVLCPPVLCQDLYSLKINEICSWCGNEDAIEIYNAGDTAIELEELVLKDHLDGVANEVRFCLGHIEPHGFWCVPCPNFLNKNGEEIGIFDVEGNCLDRIAFPESECGTFGRYPDGSDTWCFQARSLGEPNFLGYCPPVSIANMRHAPLITKAGDPVTVTFSVVAAEGPENIHLAYIKLGNVVPSPLPELNSNGWFFEPVFDDGMHNDGEAADNSYSARIPPSETTQYMAYCIVSRQQDDALAYLSRTIILNYGYEPPGLRINEILAMNRKTGSWREGDVGPFADYIELYNAGDTRINAAQLMITDSYYKQIQTISSNPQRPLWIEPGGHLLVWATESLWGIAPVGVCMNLSHNGEDVFLLAPDRISIIDHVAYPHLGPDEAYGRQVEGTGDFLTLYEPTPQGGDVFPPGVIGFVGCSLALASPDDAIPVKAWVSNETNPLTVQVLYKIDEIDSSLELYDDGTHGDEAAFDGIYQALIPPLGTTGDLELAIIMEDASGETYRDPADTSAWFSVPIGTEKKTLLINEVYAPSFGEGDACPDTWIPGQYPDPYNENNLTGKYVEIYNTGNGTVEDGHLIITSSMYNWTEGVRFKTGHISQMGQVKAFPLEELDARGGMVYLRGDETGTLYDAISYPATGPGRSYGRCPDGGSWMILEKHTYNRKNCPPFKRGDANGDESVNISDAIGILAFLFSAGSTDCKDALDANDDGAVNIADAVYLLAYLFAEGQPPPPPFESPGHDTTSDPLDCGRE